jgi:hypothetical protein
LIICEWVLIYLKSGSNCGWNIPLDLFGRAARGVGSRAGMDKVKNGLTKSSLGTIEPVGQKSIYPGGLV